MFNLVLLSSDLGQTRLIGYGIIAGIAIIWLIISESIKASKKKAVYTETPIEKVNIPEEKKERKKGSMTIFWLIGVC